MGDPLGLAGCGGSLQGKPKSPGWKKRGPKPEGTGPHNDAIANVIAKNKLLGHKHIGGGGKKTPELIIKTPGGHKPYRRPDASFRHKDTGEIFHVNVGRKNQRSGLEKGGVDPIIRERKALEDIRNIGENISFEHYNP